MKEGLHLVDDKYATSRDPIVLVVIHRSSSTSYILVEIILNSKGKASYELGGITRSEFEGISLDHQYNTCHMYL